MSDLDEFFNSQIPKILECTHGWEFEREGDLVYFSLSSRDAERYRLLIICDGYKNSPPDAIFVDATGSKMTKSAWPDGDNRFHEYIKPPNDCFICMPLIRGGIARHPEWQTNAAADVWDPARHTIVDICNFVQRELNTAHYTGRMKP